MFRRSTRVFAPPAAHSSSSAHDVFGAGVMIQPPRNFGFVIVPQGQECVVERLGRFSCVLGPGISMLVPFLDRVRYTWSIKELNQLIPHQSAITRDNVVVNLDGVLFLRIIDSHKASYSIENPIAASVYLAQTTMRSEIGKMTLDKLFEEREQLNFNIVETIKREAVDWGIEVKRYEIRDIAVSELVRQSMDLQAEAERRKRKAVLESEGEMEARVNAAKGERLAQEQLALASKFTQVTAAEAGAESLKRSTDAVGQSLDRIAKTMRETPRAADAVQFRLAEQYIEQFGHIAKTGNTVVLSGTPAGDPSAMVANAMSMFKSLCPSLCTNTNSTSSPSCETTTSSSSSSVSGESRQM